MGKTVVVLGGSLGGLAVTHRLLKYTQPHEEDLKVILVSKVRKPEYFLYEFTTRYFHNTASTRLTSHRTVTFTGTLPPLGRSCPT